jgi:hypothetical protein
MRGAFSALILPYTFWFFFAVQPAGDGCVHRYLFLFSRLKRLLSLRFSLNISESLNDIVWQ